MSDLWQCRAKSFAHSLEVSLQASVYLARSGKARGVRASSKARNVHAPARRLARTTISLGPEEGIIFGLRAIRSAALCLQGLCRLTGVSLKIGWQKVGVWRVQGLLLCQWTHRKGCLRISGRQCSSHQVGNVLTTAFFLPQQRTVLRQVQICSDSEADLLSAELSRRPLTGLGTLRAALTGGPTASSCDGCCGQCATAAAPSRTATLRQTRIPRSLNGSCRSAPCLVPLSLES